MEKKFLDWFCRGMMLREKKCIDIELPIFYSYILGSGTTMIIIFIIMIWIKILEINFGIMGMYIPIFFGVVISLISLRSIKEFRC